MNLATSDMQIIMVTAITGLFTLLGIVVKGVFDTRADGRESKEAIKPLVKQLRAVDQSVARIEKTLIRHLEWHVTDKEPE